ncbi:group-specific protein [Bacillus sp. BRMEA1]|uniref:group-specific protein n=1 Tax=Neobacillus endophyticus TaxID=2738405 RepID=UPI001567113F|nr:group-specific protein [Neobacillus endophyticus]NRD76449.1 group-specific protein [Neobacillus endophyticus]
MSTCKLDHSHEDVKQKYESQKDYLPEEMKQLFEQFFAKEHTQDLLNEVFHLLKKYDLAAEEEKSERKNRLYMILHNV